VTAKLSVQVTTKLSVQVTTKLSVKVTTNLSVQVTAKLGIGCLALALAGSAVRYLKIALCWTFVMARYW